jgi:hypothetical protein
MCSPVVGKIATGVLSGGAIPAMQALQKTKMEPFVNGAMLGAGVPLVQRMSPQSMDGLFSPAMQDERLRQNRMVR